MSGRTGISKLGLEARRERARKAARARWSGWGDQRLRERVEVLRRAIERRGGAGSTWHVRNLERLLEWLKEGESDGA